MTHGTETPCGRCFCFLTVPARVCVAASERALSLAIASELGELDRHHSCEDDRGRQWPSETEAFPENES